MSWFVSDFPKSKPGGLITLSSPSLNLTFLTDLIHLLHNKTLRNVFYHETHVADEETEAQRGLVTQSEWLQNATVTSISLSQDKL